MRTEEDLQKLYDDLVGWFKYDFEIPFSSYEKEVGALLSKMQEEKIYAFLKRRIGHLKDEDILRFVEVFLANGVSGAMKEASILTYPSLRQVENMIEKKRGRPKKS